MRDQTSQNRPRNGGGRPFKKKGRKGFNRGAGNDARAARGPQGQGGQNGAPGVCIKCGHPAPDGKLCNFHRALLNSIRNDFGKKSPRGHSPMMAID